MPFWKKMFNKKQGVYYPRAIVQGKPVETETIAKDLEKISTVSNSDVQAVLGDIAGVMHTRMSQGKSVHIKGLGYFRYVLDTKGVKDLKDFVGIAAQSLSYNKRSSMCPAIVRKCTKKQLLGETTSKQLFSTS